MRTWVRGRILAYVGQGSASGKPCQAVQAASASVRRALSVTQLLGWAFSSMSLGQVRRLVERLHDEVTLEAANTPPAPWARSQTRRQRATGGASLRR